MQTQGVNKTEGRRATRVTGAFWIRINGVDPKAVLRRGNMSTGGLFFEVEAPVGDVGSVQQVEVATADGERSVVVLARVARVLSLDDLHRARAVLGIAMEFMPEDLETRNALQELVQHVLYLTAPGSEGEEEAPPVSQLAKVITSELEFAETYQLSVSRMMLETSWPAVLGETVELAFRSLRPEGRVPFLGTVVAIEPKTTESEDESRYRVQVEFSDGVQSTPDQDFADAPVNDSVDLLFGSLAGNPLGQSSALRREHLSGILSRIRLTSLLALFEMERMSGRLDLSRGDESFSIFIREGQILDIESSAVFEKPMDAIAHVMRWAEGDFDFRMEEVERPDRFGIRTTAILLEVARQEDEESNGSTGSNGTMGF